MTRREDWPTRLVAALEAARGLRFQYGAHDCCLFAARCAEAMTGVDLTAGLPPYGTSWEALGVMAQYGGLEGLLEAIATQHDCPEVPVLEAQRGDVVLVDADLGPTVGVVVGAQVAIPTATGWGTVPLRRARRAWRI